MLKYLSLSSLGGIAALFCFPTMLTFAQTAPQIISVPPPAPANGLSAPPPNFPSTELFSGPNGSLSFPPTSTFSSPLGSPPAFEFSPSTTPSPPNMMPSAPFPQAPPSTFNQIPFGSPFNASPVDSLNSYRVEVEGRSPSLLYAVKAVEPLAFIREMDGVIQAGSFSRADNAEKRVIELKNRGIQSRVVTNSRTLGAIGSPPSNNYVTTLDSEDLRYMVVVPGTSDSLDLIVNRIVNAGISSSLVVTRSGPFSPNVAVGPFANRDEAERWNSVIRSLRLDSRVRYE